MKINTRDGVEIYVLPENAKCIRTGKSPLEMGKCPLCNFDDYGDECVPDVCEYYTEEGEDGN